MVIVHARQKKKHENNVNNGTPLHDVCGTISLLHSAGFSCGCLTLLSGSSAASRRD
jgi:hypothetical protein